jgi:Mg-chelatase subunit ChlD
MMSAAKRRSIQIREHGAVLPLLLVSIVAFSVLAAGALTLGRLVTAHQDLQHAADSVALGAGNLIFERGRPTHASGFASAEIVGRYNYGGPTRALWTFLEPPDGPNLLTEVRITTLDSFAPISSYFPSLGRPLSATSKVQVHQSVIGGVTKRRSQLVLVLDFSGSMALPIAENEQRAAIDVLKDSVNAVLALDLDAEIGAVFFAGDVLFETPVSYSAQQPEIQQGLNHYRASGTTATGAALNEARELLVSSEDRGRYIILISDGEPTEGGFDPYAFGVQAAHAAWGANITTFTVDIHRKGASDMQAQFLRELAGDAKYPGNPANALVATSATALADSLHRIIAGILCESPPIDPAPKLEQQLHVFLRSPGGDEAPIPALPDLSCDPSRSPQPPGCAPSYSYDASKATVKFSAAACDLITIQGYKAVVRYDRPTLVL